MINIGKIDGFVNDEIERLKREENDLDVLKGNYESFKVKNIDDLISKCNYRIGNLENAHKYSDVADNIEIQKNIEELTSHINSLQAEVNDLETIKNNLSITFSVVSYNSTSKEIVAGIDEIKTKAEAVIEKGNLVISGNFDEIKEDEKKGIEVTPVVEEKKDDIVVNNVVENTELTPTEIKTDSLEQLNRDLVKEFNPVDSKLINEINSNDFGFDKVISREEMNKPIAPILNPVTEPSLKVDSVIAVPEKEEKIPVIEDIKQESAKSVDEGAVLVTGVEEFVQDNTDKMDSGQARKLAV